MGTLSLTRKDEIWRVFLWSDLSGTFVITVLHTIACSVTWFAVHYSSSGVHCTPYIVQYEALWTLHTVSHGSSCKILFCNMVYSVLLVIRLALYTCILQNEALWTFCTVSYGSSCNILFCNMVCSALLVIQRALHTVHCTIYGALCMDPGEQLLVLIATMFG